MLPTYVQAMPKQAPHPHTEESDHDDELIVLGFFFGLVTLAPSSLQPSLLGSCVRGYTTVGSVAIRMYMYMYVSLPRVPSVKAQRRAKGKEVREEK